MGLGLHQGENDRSSQSLQASIHRWWQDKTGKGKIKTQNQDLSLGKRKSWEEKGHGEHWAGAWLPASKGLAGFAHAASGDGDSTLPASKGLAGFAHAASGDGDSTQQQQPPLPLQGRLGPAWPAADGGRSPLAAA